MIDRHYLALPVVVAVVAVIIYYLTSATGVAYIDSGELAANCAKLGIAHPTGYPLYNCLGRLAVVFLGSTPIRDCVILSAVIAGVASGLLCLLILAITERMDTAVRDVAAVSASLFASLTPVWWSQGTTNEVYGLTLLFNLLTLYFVVSFMQNGRSRHLGAVFYFWGLALGSHLSSIFIFPAIIYALWTKKIIRHGFLKRIFIPLILCALALTVYLYLPIRSVHKPFLNWSNPSSWQGFINHISGWQYRVWMFTSIDHMMKGITYFGDLAASQFGMLGLFFVVVGLVKGFREKRHLTVFALIVLAADLIYSSNYEIVDIDSYYLLAFVVMAIFFAYGIAAAAFMVGRLLPGRNRQKIQFAVSLAVGALMIATTFASSLPSQNRTGDRLAESGVNNILNSCPDSSLVFIENWDYYSPWLYYHYVENRRPDVVFIDKELLRRSWYIDFLFRYHPEIMASVTKQADQFLKLLEPFESGGRYDGAALTRTMTAMIEAIIKNNCPVRPVYSNFVGGQFFEFKKVYIPVGALYLLSDSVFYVESDTSSIDISAWESGGPLVDKRAKIALGQIYRVVASRAIYCQAFGRTDEAESWRRLGERIKAIIERK